jgi:hypothetical protein
MLRIYCIGLCILVGAILLNAVAAKLGLMSWYDFLTQWSANGKSVFSTTRLIDYVWLMLIYPFLLGCCGYGANVAYTKWFT